jgi:regulation of enolase protein 1 (concanavalin A-like superfamily)
MLRTVLPSSARTTRGALCCATLIAAGWALAAVVQNCAAAEPQKAEVEPPSDAAKHETVLRDDFSGKYSLNWKIIREDKSHLSLSANPDRLTITTQRGAIHGDSDHDTLSGGVRTKNIFLIPNSLGDAGDFSITLAVSKFAPTIYFQQVALICYDDDDNYLKWTFEQSWRKPDTQCFTLVRETDMVPQHDLIVELPNPGRFWLRVTKRGNEYECAYSTDGRDFTVAGSRPWGKSAPKYLGFLAKNGGNPLAEEIDVLIDSFELRSPPPAPAPRP